jgi:hypothetical protein
MQKKKKIKGSEVILEGLENRLFFCSDYLIFWDNPQLLHDPTKAPMLGRNHSILK